EISSCPWYAPFFAALSQQHSSAILMISNTHARGLSAAADFHCWCNCSEQGRCAPDSTAGRSSSKGLGAPEQWDLLCSYAYGTTTFLTAFGMRVALVRTRHEGVTWGSCPVRVAARGQCRVGGYRRRVFLT